MKTKLILFALLISFAAAFAQERAKLLKADESGFIEVDKLPALVSPLRPEYPQLAKLAGIQGTVYLKLLIDEKGNVEKAKVEQGVKDMIDEAALNAAKSAEFSPAMLNNKPIKVWVILPVAFKLSVEKNADARVMRYDELEPTQQENSEKEPDINKFVQVEKLPEMIESAKPDYPEAAKKAGIEAKVFVKVLVDKEGNPKKAIVIKSENEIFNQSAVNAAMKSRFTSAVNKGEKVAVWVVLPYRYTLGRKEKGESEIFESPDKAKNYYNGFTSLYEGSPEERAKAGDIDKDFKFEKIVGKISFGDQSGLYKVTKAGKTKYDFIARSRNKIYKYVGAGSIKEIQKYVEDLKKKEK
ncbi:MAG: energy transducer TonB [Bacteroidetes bacterium]|nr:energy transducer TonB [Bacteroidota bacterium]